jgi:hypothetical protein
MRAVLCQGFAAKWLPEPLPISALKNHQVSLGPDTLQIIIHNN